MACTEHRIRCTNVRMERYDLGKFVARSKPRVSLIFTSLLLFLDDTQLLRTLLQLVVIGRIFWQATAN